MTPHCEPTRLSCPWNSPGENTGVGCHFLLQGILLTQGSNLGLLYCRQITVWATREACGVVAASNVTNRWNEGQHLPLSSSYKKVAGEFGRSSFNRGLRLEGSLQWVQGWVERRKCQMFPEVEPWRGGSRVEAGWSPKWFGLGCFKEGGLKKGKCDRKWKSFSCVWLFATPWTVAHQAPLSMGFSRQEY